jgi:sugar O-acyltransferase (sialic acid O-acetyltransferase NeuD family)
LKPLWIIGSGGHAKVVIETVRASGTFRLAGILDDRADRRGERVLDVPIRGVPSPEVVGRLGVELAVIAIGRNRARAEMAERLDGLVAWATVVHPSACVARTARLGAGAVVFAGAIVQPDAAIGRHTILNTASSTDHDCIVADFAHLAPGVRLAGEVRVERGAFLGVGSCVLPQRSVGAWATVGAGGVVVHDIPGGTTAVGVPARPLRLVDPDPVPEPEPEPEPTGPEPCPLR